jgi:hypothetical protein
MKMNYEELDVTLKNGQIINDWLASWIAAVSENPKIYRAVITESTAEGKIIELQDDQGIASGGIVFMSSRGTVHVLGAVDPKNEPFTKKRSIKEMIGALDIALHKQEKERRIAVFFKACLSIFFLLLILFVFYILNK